MFSKEGEGDGVEDPPEEADGAPVGGGAAAAPAETFHSIRLGEPRRRVAATMISRQPSRAGQPGSPAGGSEQQYLAISVTDPVKLGSGVQAYISYRVSTKTNLTDYRGVDKIVIRRYSDFVWLHDRLVEKYKGLFIPPLPEKSAVEKFRFSAEFIEVRRRALEVFLNRIASHRKLRLSDDLKNFLQADEELWALERARSAEGSSVFKKKPGDIVQMFKDVQMKVTDAVLGKDKPLEESNAEYEKVKHYIEELEDHVSEAQKQAFRLVKRQRELSQGLADFGKAIRSLGDCEGGSVGQAFSVLGGQSELLSIKLQQQAQELLMNFEEPIKEYVRIVQSIKVAMADRAVAYRLQKDLSEAYKLKELNLEKLRLVRPDKVPEAEGEVREMRIQSTDARMRFDEIVTLMSQEMERFQEEKTKDLGLILVGFAKAQAQMAADTAEAWRSLLPKLDAASQADGVRSPHDTLS